jgi:hypothetical protein
LLFFFSLTIINKIFGGNFVGRNNFIQLTAKGNYLRIASLLICFFDTEYSVKIGQQYLIDHYLHFNLFIMPKTFTISLASILFLLIYSYNCMAQPIVLPLKYSLTNKHTIKTHLEKLLTAASWNKLFPNRIGMTGNKAQKNFDFYSCANFVKAARLFPQFLAEGNDTLQRRELAAFLANIAQETSGGWPTAPGGYFKWGLYYLEEQKPTSNYADKTKTNYPPVAGVAYFGRGPKQLSWNYNYGQFSEAWYGTKDSLLQHPERLSEDGVISFASAIWFWMTPQPPKPSCHNIMVGNWKPTADDVAKGRVPGFGATLNVINGGVECGTGTEQQHTKDRYDYYRYFCQYLQVSPGENISCSNQTPFGR